MRFVFKIIGLILITIFIGFALKNTDEAALRFFLNYEIHAPLILIVFGFLVIGFVLGILAMMPMVFRHRRDLSKHKKIIVTMQKENEEQQHPRLHPLSPDGVVNQQ